MYHFDFEIAKATAREYVRETALAQVAYDRVESIKSPDIEPLIIAENWLNFCQSKVSEWTRKAWALDPQRRLQKLGFVAGNSAPHGERTDFAEELAEAFPDTRRA